MGTPPDNPSQADDLVSWIRGELDAISKAMQEPDFLTFKVWNTPPPKPREGSQAFADGTNWNPGSGKGFYEYRSGAWQKL